MRERDKKMKYIVCSKCGAKLKERLGEHVCCVSLFSLVARSLARSRAPRHVVLPFVVVPFVVPFVVVDRRSSSPIVVAIWSLVDQQQLTDGKYAYILTRSFMYSFVRRREFRVGTLIMIVESVRDVPEPPAPAGSGGGETPRSHRDSDAHKPRRSKGSVTSVARNT